MSADNILEDKGSLVQHSRLVNGDEIIAEYVSEDEKSIRFKHPMIVSEKEDPETKLATVTLSKYVMFYDEDVTLQKSHIMTRTLVMDEIRDYYYNSIAYSARFIEPMILSEIDKINQIMKSNLAIPDSELEQIMKPRKKRKKQASAKVNDKLVVYPANNSVH